jgi:hypothetical protein
MTHPCSKFSGLAYSAASTLVVAAMVHLPGAVTRSPALSAAQPTAPAPAYPHDINPDPNGPYYNCRTCSKAA